MGQVKKFTIIVLALIYLLSATGVSAERFYCCGKLARTTFAIGDSGNTENNKISKVHKCCKTTKRTFKVKDSHVGSGGLFVAKVAPAALPPVILCLPAVSESTPVNWASRANAPPDRQQIPVYILNCTYRI